MNPMLRGAIRLLRTLVLVLAGAVAHAENHDDTPVVLAIDAEFGVKTSTAAQAILRGAEIAAAEINAAGGVLDGRPLKIVTRNNHGHAAAAAENLRELAADRNVVAVMGGRASSVVRAQLPLLQELGMPYLLPWATGDDLTTAPLTPNPVFRLSLTDTWVMQTMIFSAFSRGLLRLGLIVPNNEQGHASAATAKRIVDAARVRGIRLLAEQTYKPGDSDHAARYDALRQAGADAVMLVANEVDAAALVREVGARPKAERLPLLSHCDVTGGQFFRLAGEALTRVDFSLVQSYSFIDRHDLPARRVVAALQKSHGVDAHTIDSPMGLAHAYDLTHLLARAVKRAGTTNRAALRNELEQLPEHRGLIRHYLRPFAPTRHEALDPSLAFMARYAPDGSIVRVR